MTDDNEPIKKSDVIAFFLRLVFWGVTIGILAICKASQNSVLNGIILGIIAGDIITWLIVTIMIELPKSLLTPSLDIVVNVVIVYLVLNVFGIEWPADRDAQAMCFLAMIATAALKFFTYFWYFFVTSD